jgi:DNA-binding NarL/FixJ family response regulator
MDLHYKIVLADDHAIVREGFAALLAANGLEVIGQAQDGEAAVAMILEMRPDFAILDFEMPPGITGVEAVRRLRAAGSSAKLMILSIVKDQETVLSAIQAGADAYLVKGGPVRHLLDAMSFVREGGVYISPIVGGAAVLTHSAAHVATDPLEVLSPREREVFRYLVGGMRAKDIAELLRISPKTVDTYRASLMRKLNCKDLVELVKFAIEHGLDGGPPKKKRD